jgi:hypothetical protein
MAGSVASTATVRVNKQGPGHGAPAGVRAGGPTGEKTLPATRSQGP